MALISGIHHVTSITADAQKNIDFYTGVLGLRLVKLTVNFDDPSSYHLYYGDELGSPGSIMTFFAWPGASRGQIGAPQVTTTSFTVPATALPFWKERLERSGTSFTLPAGLHAEGLLAFQDPDGLSLQLVASPSSENRTPWSSGGVPADQAIRGFFGVTISVEGYESTARILTEVMGFEEVGGAAGTFRFRSGHDVHDGIPGGPDGVIDIVCVPGGRHGTVGAGTVHHVAFATPTAVQQREWQTILRKFGLNVSPVMDRSYFQSIYFREPSGVLFEIATEGPGFTSDESAQLLGTTLKLPPQFERSREAIERSLPKLVLPSPDVLA